MSIHPILEAQRRVQKLVIYKPTVAPRGLPPRTIWMTPETHEWCFPNGKHPDGVITLEALTQMRDVLNTFSLGREVEQDLDLKQLKPFDREVWEFRSYIKKPYLRIFGSFALPGHFVAVGYRRRDELDKRENGPKWKSVINETIDRRNTVLNGELPFEAQSFRGYLG